MSRNRQMQEQVCYYFAEEQVPYEIHVRLLHTCENLESKPQRKGFYLVWKRLAVSGGAAAAAFLLLCSVNAVHPALAESFPLIGKVFQLYNQGKTTVGTYVGTYPGVSQVNAGVQGENTNGASLSLHQSYCDGTYAYLAFSMEGVDTQLMNDLYYLAGTVSGTADGKPFEKTDVVFYPEGEKLLAAVSVPLAEPRAQGDACQIAFTISDLSRYFDQGGQWESVPGTFTGKTTVTVDTSFNQTLENIRSNGKVQIHTVEATPSSTKIRYTIPFWGISSYTINFPRLYLEDGTCIAFNLNESDMVSPDEISRDAETLTCTAAFDGVPKGTEKVILRFLEEDMDAYTLENEGEKGAYIGVLAEVTIDLSTGEAEESTSYLQAGMSYAQRYTQHFDSIHWRMFQDDPDMIDLGQSSWSKVTAVPGLFRNGESLWSVSYSDTLEVCFATDGSKPEKAYRVTVENQAGESVAAGELSPETAVKETAGGDAYYTWKAEMKPVSGKEPAFMDYVTVTLSDTNTGEMVYQRTVRLASKEENP